MGIHQHFGIHIVERIASRQLRIAHARHFRGILAQEVSHIGHVTPLLQHVVAPLQVPGEYVHLTKPRVMAVELISKIGIDTGHAVVGLLDVEMQQRGVDAFGKEAVAALLHLAGILREVGTAARERLGPHLLLAIDMSARRSATVLDITQFAKAPELAGDFVRLRTILQELAGEAPMAVVLQPRGESMTMTGFAQTADIVIRNLIGNEAAHIPKETVRLLAAAHHNPAVNGHKGHGVVTVGTLEILNHMVGPVLTAGFVTIFHHNAESLAVLRRNAFQDKSDVIVEVGIDMFLAHLVGFKSAPLDGCRTVHRTGGHHGRAHHHPLPFGHAPGERTVRSHTVGQVDHLRGLHASIGIAAGLLAPKVSVPHRMRRLPHLGKRFLGVSLHRRDVRERDALNQAGFFHVQPILATLRFGQCNDDGSKRIISDIDFPVAAVGSVFVHEQFGFGIEGFLNGANHQATHLDRLLAAQVNGGSLGEIFQHAELGSGCLQRVGQDLHILSILTHIGQTTLEVQGADQSVLDTSQIAHRLRGLHPRTARLAPTGTVEKADLNV